ncbi:tRNA pseudouridine(38-40) synthase TruA [Tumebacillus sp. ITR2]|uniref:tRNA pseudouridine synthase A n=1 Tax=Tumebacillus amylolyticus TaxID=2801339 RepID=A0ABS1JGG2_9BACL|nr:tRNA pseudouridine(38-40) synthase TruA [Tumebacillus amylolyticus]MBL0389377.1 tRNA pseudouridine(38-40) synthase TruA [Tumebacillus amylolyticus]
MRNIKLILAYDGTEFHGFQTQPNLRTVQGLLQKTIEDVVGHSVSIIGSGRTDAGVHARGQVVNFATSSRIPIEKWPIVLNTKLPDDLVIQDAEVVPDDWHARFCAIGKEYRYRIDRSPYTDVFWRKYSHHVPYPLRLEPMREAAGHLVGRHDFTSFCAANTPVVDKVRHLHNVEVIEEGSLLTVVCRGEGFLYNMVRIIAGTLLDVGRGKLSPDQIPGILAACDRTQAGVTAPAKGLTMWKVFYAQNGE